MSEKIFHEDIKNIDGVTIITPNALFPDIKSIIAKGDYTKNMLKKSGLLLFRDFNVESPDKFKDLATVFANDLMSDNGEHNPLASTDKVYTPVSYSPSQKLLWHNENSFNHHWPLIIMFGCVKPAEIGGETPVVDSRKVLASLDKEVVDEFSQKGVMYVRSHGFGFGRSWQETYRTENTDKMESLCNQMNIHYKWLGEDQLVTKQVRPAIVRHPITDEFSWFNQAQHWHPYCLQQGAREYLLETFTEETLPRNCLFGDGSIIPNETMQHIMDVYQQHEVSFPWQKGDVMVLDNVLFAHARNAYSGERKLFVTMGKHACFLDIIKPDSAIL
jgi:alpha-ketoglutarate-dependent taurine dioxygenase